MDSVCTLSCNWNYSCALSKLWSCVRRLDFSLFGYLFVSSMAGIVLMCLMKQNATTDRWGQAIVSSYNSPHTSTCRGAVETSMVINGPSDRGLLCLWIQ